MMNRVSFALNAAIAYAIIHLQAILKWSRSLTRKPQIHWTQPYDGRPILLMALFQKGRLRSDTRALFEAARAEGYYIVAVNSLVFKDRDALEGICDTYIERFNYGRDFGSYKTGVLHLIGDEKFASCPRVLMMNDSVFVCRDRIAPFLRAHRDTEYEVLGATENYDREHHIGSFCVSFSGGVFRHSKFRDFFRQYRNSEIRPVVIDRGEFGLSRALRASSTSAEEFTTLYSSTRFHDLCNDDPEFLPIAVDLARTSDIVPWKRLSLLMVLEDYEEEYLRAVVERKRLTLMGQIGNLAPIREMKYITIGDVDRYLSESVGDLYDPGHFREYLAARATEVFMIGSQIHQNAAVLVKMGLPIVKLDGLYRGLFSVRDINRIISQLDDEDGAALRQLLFQRPYGGDTLEGWRKYAFYLGML